MSRRVFRGPPKAGRVFSVKTIQSRTACPLGRELPSLDVPKGLARSLGPALLLSPEVRSGETCSQVPAPPMHKTQAVLLTPSRLGWPTGDERQKPTSTYQGRAAKAGSRELLAEPLGSCYQLLRLVPVPGLGEGRTGQGTAGTFAPRNEAHVHQSQASWK